MIRIYHARILTMEEDQDIFDGEIWISRYSEERGGAEGIERFCFRNQIDPKKLRHECNINNWFYVL